jgi:hypothetical protein
METFATSGKQSIEKCVGAIVMFFRNLRRKFGDHVLLTISDLAAPQLIRTKRGDIVLKNVPTFQVKGIPTYSDDPECSLYGQLLYENKLGLHSLRHWFSVQLVLHGEDIAQIQYWRGDKCPESAFVYLQNKGDLVRKLERTSAVKILPQFLCQKAVAVHP